MKRTSIVLAILIIPVALLYMNFTNPDKPISNTNLNKDIAGNFTYPASSTYF